MEYPRFFRAEFFLAVSVDESFGQLRMLGAAGISRSVTCFPKGLGVEEPGQFVACGLSGGERFLNFDDAALSAGLRRFLEERFPEPCRYERGVGSS